MDKAWHSWKWLQWLLRLLKALAPRTRPDQPLDGETRSFLGGGGRGDLDGRSVWVSAESSPGSTQPECPPPFSYAYGNGGARPAPVMYTYVAGTRSEPVPTTASFGTQAIAVPFGTAVAVPFGTAVAESERSPWEESCSGLRQDKEADAQAPAKFSRGAT